MDEQNSGQKPQDDGVQINVTTTETTAPIINDVTPPPAPKVNESESVQVKTAPTETVEETPPAQDESADAQIEESLSAVAEAPEENQEPEATETERIRTVTESEGASESTNDAQDNSSAPVMGIAASEMNKAPHRNNRKFAVIITVVVALMLAGIAVYVYISANNNASSSKNNQSSNTTSNVETDTVTEVTPATIEDIDTTDQELDSAINALDETADFAEQDLSDTTLNL